MTESLYGNSKNINKEILFPERGGWNYNWHHQPNLLQIDDIGNAEIVFILVKEDPSLSCCKLFQQDSLKNKTEYGKLGHGFLSAVAHDNYTRLMFELFKSLNCSSSLEK